MGLQPNPQWLSTSLCLNESLQAVVELRESVEDVLLSPRFITSSNEALPSCYALQFVSPLVRPLQWYAEGELPRPDAASRPQAGL